MPFTDFFCADIGDAQAVGQKPITFLRQVTSLILGRNSYGNESFPKDVQKRVEDLLKDLPGQSISVYSGQFGIPLVRQHIAEYITRRDGGIPAYPENIICSNGATDAIINTLSLFGNSDNEPGGKCGVLSPVPQYPLYKDAIALFEMHQVNYNLDEEECWALSIPELENVLKSAREVCKPKVLVVINPGNPTGQVLTRQCIEDVIKFAYRERLFIFADEVYQANIHEQVPFHSFKKVMSEMGEPYSSMEMASFMSVSKGYAGECGLRGGYMEMINVCPKVREMFNVLLQMELCPSAIGQVALDCVVKEPVKGEESYELFNAEKNDILESQKRRSKMISEAFNGFKRVTCNPVMGALYAFPRLHFPDKAIAEAQRQNMKPDELYVNELLNATGEIRWKIFDNIEN